MSDLLQDVWQTIGSDPFAAGLIGVAVLVALYAFNEDIRRLAGYPSDRQLARTLADWLHGRGGFSLRRTRIEKDAFSILAEQAAGGATLEVLKKRGSHTIMIRAGLKVSEGHRAALAKGPESERRGLYEDILIEFSKLGVQLHMQAENFHISKIDMWHVLPTDSPTAFGFLESVGRVLRAEICADQLITRRARLASQATTETENSGLEIN